MDWKRLTEDVFAKEAAWLADCAKVESLLDSMDVVEDAADEARSDQARLLSALIQNSGWSRRKTYALLFQQLPESPHADLIEDLLDGVCGWCHFSHVMRFDGDPEDQSELASYARGSNWMHEDRFSAHAKEIP